MNEVRSTIDLPLAGEVLLSIVRTAPEDARTMDLIESFLRRIEEFMGWPFPDRHVIYYMHDWQEGESTFSYFKGTHVQITMFTTGERGLYFPRIVEWDKSPLLEYASGYRYRSHGETYSETTCTYPDGTSFICGKARNVDGQSWALGEAFSGQVTMIHEAVHYYFNGRGGNEDCYAHWLTEGAPVFLTYLLVKRLNPDLPFPDLNTYYTARTLNPCEVETLAEAEHLDGLRRLDCMYLLGGQLFEELYQTMDETDFRLAFRRMFLHTRVDTAVCDDNRTPVCYVREAFTAYASETERPIVEEIIDRWHGGS